MPEDGVKLYINDEEVVLPKSEARISQLSDRMMVHSEKGSNSAVAVRKGDSVLVSYKGKQYKVEKRKPRARKGAAAGTGEIHAPMPGQIVDVLVKEGDSVKQGDKILVLEAMKTQQSFTAHFDGTVEKLPVQKAQQVNEGELLALIAPAS